MKKILLCPPTYYDIEYEINPWMDMQNKVDAKKALESYNALKAKIIELGAETFEIDPVDGLPDMVYTANFGEVCDGRFIPANFRYPQRRAETKIASDYFQEKFGYQIAAIPENIYFEGQGDLLDAGDAYFFGHGKRSMIEALPYLEKYLNKPVIDLETTNSYFYHLDTCFGPLDKDTVIINQKSFTKEGLDKINAHFKNVIQTSEEDNKVMACNLLCLGKNIILGKGISEELKNNVEKLGYTIHEIEMGEYRKGGGSVCCTSFWFN